LLCASVVELGGDLFSFPPLLFVRAFCFVVFYGFVYFFVSCFYFVYFVFGPATICFMFSSHPVVLLLLISVSLSRFTFLVFFFSPIFIYSLSFFVSFRRSHMMVRFLAVSFSFSPSPCFLILGQPGDSQPGDRLTPFFFPFDFLFDFSLLTLKNDHTLEVLSPFLRRRHDRI